MSASGRRNTRPAMIQLLLLRRWSWSRGSGEPPDGVAKHQEHDDHGRKRIAQAVAPRSIAASRRELTGYPTSRAEGYPSRDRIVGAASATRPEPASSACQVGGGQRQLQDPAHVEPIRRSDRGARAVDPGIQLSRPASGAAGACAPLSRPSRHGGQPGAWEEALPAARAAGGRRSRTSPRAGSRCRRTTGRAAP